LTRMEIVHERHVWIVVTAVLATSLAWLAVVSLAVVAGAWTRHFPEALAVLRALARAALTVGRLGGPAALAALAGAVILIGAALRPRRHAEGRARHA
jgi:hypothetical protein